MPFSYSQILDQWDRSRAFGDPRPLVKFASDLNVRTGTQDYNEGLRDGSWTRFSHRLDQTLQGEGPYENPLTTEIGQDFTEAGGVFGSVFGNEEAGRSVGANLPRAFLDTLPLYLAGPEAGIPATAAAALGTGALMGAHTYADTGSAKAGVISGATGALLPTVGKVGGAWAARAFGGGERVAGELVSTGQPVNALLPKTASDVGRFQAASFLGKQASEIALNQASMYATNKTLGQEYDPASPQFWLQQIPFTVVDALHTVSHTPKTSVDVSPLLRVPGSAKPEVPVYIPPSGTVAEHMDLMSTMQKFVGLKESGAPSESVDAALAALNVINTDPALAQKAKNEARQNDSELPVSLAGRARRYGDSWKMEVNDAQGEGSDKVKVPEHKNVWINSLNVALDEASGQHVFHGKVGDLGGEVSRPLAPEVVKSGGLPVNENPELPPQENPSQNPTAPPVVPEQPAKTQVDVVKAQSNVDLALQKLNELTTNPPTDPVEIVSALRNPEAVKSKISSGMPANIAIEKALISEHIEDLDQAQEELRNTQQIAKGQEIYFRLGELASQPTPEGEAAARVVKAYSEAGANAKNQERIYEHLNSILGKWGEAKGKVNHVESWNGSSETELIKKFNKAAEKDVTDSRGEGIRNDAGRATMPYEEAAQLIKDKQLEKTHEVVKAGRDAKGKDRVMPKLNPDKTPNKDAGKLQYKVQEKVTKASKETSLDAVRTSEGSSLHDKIKEATPQADHGEEGQGFDVAAQEEEESRENKLNRLADVTSDDVENAIGLEGPEADSEAGRIRTIADAFVNDAGVDLATINDKLRAQGLHEFESPNEYLAYLKNDFADVQSYLVNDKPSIQAALKKDGTLPEHLEARTKGVGGILAGKIYSSLAAAEVVHGEVNPTVKEALTKGTNKDVSEATLSVLADEVPGLEKVLWQMKGDVEVAEKQNKLKPISGEKGSLNTSILSDSISAIKSKLDTMVKAIRKYKNALKEFLGLNNFTVDGAQNLYIQTMSGDEPPVASNGVDHETNEVAQKALLLRPETAADVRARTSREELENGKSVSSWFQRTFMFTQFLKKQIPAFASVADHISDQQGFASERMYELNNAYFWDPVTKEIDKARIESNNRVKTNPALNKAASNIYRYARSVSTSPEGFDWNAPYVKKTLAPFNASDRQAIRTEHDSQVARHTQATSLTLPQHLSDFNMERVAGLIVGSEPGMLPEDGRNLSRQIFNAALMAKNPETQLSGMAALQELVPKMQPSTFAKALNLAEFLQTSSDKTVAFMKKDLHYVNEQRLSEFMVRMVEPDGTPYNAPFKTREAALAKVKEKETQGSKLIEYLPRSEANVSGVRPEVLDQLRELDVQASNRISQLFADQPDVLEKILPAVQRANDYAGSMAAFSPVPGDNSPRWKGVKGREEIDMLENAHHYYNMLNQWMRYRMTRAVTDVDMLHPEIAGSRVVKQLASQHVENYLTNDNPYVRKANEATYHMKLAWNFGVNFLHGIQTLTTGMTNLIAETGHIGDAFERTGNATKAVIQRGVIGKWTSPDHEWLIDAATARGIKGYATYDDISDPNTNRMYAANRATSLLSKAGEGIINASKGWSGFFQSYNDQVSLIAGFDLARERGMDREEAFRFARDAKDRGLFNGGKAQRSVGLWSIKTKAVPQLMTSLQSYTQGWFSMFASNWINGFGKAPEGLTSTQRLGAKKAFLYQLGAQAVLAGAIGLPGMGQGVALLKQTTGTDLNVWTRQNLAKLFDEDQDNGGMMTALALHGAVSSFTPMDPSGKHMPSVPFIGVSPYNGFSLANLASSPVSAVADIVRGLTAAAKGDLQGAKSALPHVLQGPFELYSGEGDARDKSGNLITKLSPAEQVVMVLGMTPTRVAQQRDAAQAVKELNQQTAQEKQNTVASIAKTFRQDNRAGVQALHDYLVLHPEENQIAFARAVASHVQSQTLPQDTRLTANPGMDLAGLQSQGQLPSYADRVAGYQATQSALGVPQSRTYGMQDYRAHMIDQAMSENSYMGVQEAKEQVMQRRPSRTPGLQFDPGIFQSSGY